MALSAGKSPVPGIPLVVIGALRAGGSGKTSMTLELARALSERGCRPAILAYRLGPGRPGKGKTDPMEVGEEDDWRWSSEEAVLLRRQSGLRVFATRNRASAWRVLQGAEYQDRGRFDILLSDDGFQDPRLAGSLRLLLTAPGERPGLFDLLPAGPYRERWKARLRADLRIEGPYPDPAPGDAAAPAPDAVPLFHRRLVLPPGFDRTRPWIAFCALGHNRPFLDDLAREGIRPVAVVEGRNHGEPPLDRLRSCAARHREAGILCTEKDFLKLGGRTGLPLFRVGQSLSLDPGILRAVDAYRLLFRNGYLVHYPT